MTGPSAARSAPQPTTSSSSTEDLTSAYYKRHHAGGGDGFARYGFTIGSTTRSDWFRERIGQQKKILDIGCRDGTFSSRLLAGNDVTGIDIDDDALRAASQNHGIKTLLVNLNNERLPFGDQTFDVVVAGEVLEHLQFPELVTSEIHRVLKPTGSFLGSVPNAFRLWNRLAFLLGRDFETDPTHLHHFSPAAIQKLLASFNRVEVDFICSRHLWLSRRLMGTDMVWHAVK